MRLRVRYWGRAAVFGWHQVIGLKDHIELAIVLTLGAFALVGISLRHGPSWLLPALLALALAAMVLDGAYLQWDESESRAEAVSAPPTPHVPKNRDQVVGAIHGLERACRDVVTTSEGLRSQGVNLLETVADHEVPQPWSAAINRVHQAEERLVLARRIAGPGYRMHLIWIQFDVSDRAFDCAYGDDPDYGDVLERMANVVERAIHRLDNGELWIDGDYPGGKWKTNFIP